MKLSELIKYIAIATVIHIYIDGKLEFAYNRYSDTLKMSKYNDYNVTFISVEENVIKIEIEKGVKP